MATRTQNAWSVCSGSVYCAYKWGMSQTDDSPSRPRIGLPSWARAAIFFSANEDCHPPQYFSQSYGAMLMISYVILKYAPYDWLKCNPRLQKKKIARGRGPAARGQSVHGSIYCAYKWGVSQTDDSPSLIGLTPWRTMWSVCSRLRLLRVQVRHVTDRWLAVAYRRGLALPSWARAAIFFSANEDCHPPIFQPIIWRVF